MHAARRLAIWSGILAWGLVAWGDETAPPALESKPRALPRWRLLGAPAENPRQWPAGSESYLPIRREEFDRAVGAAAQPDVRDDALSRPLVVAAQYSASLVGDCLVGSDAQWRISRRHAASSQLALDANLALSRVRWQSLETGDASSAPSAELAIAAGPDQRQTLAAPADGIVTFDWSLRGQPAGESLTFELSLQSSLSSELNLELPASKRVDASAESPPVVSEEVTGDIRRVRLKLGAARNVRLSIVDSAKRDTAGAAQLSERLAYDITQRGLELTADYDIKPGAAPLSELVFDVDPRLTILTATMGQQSLSWSHTAGGEGAPGRIRLTLPESPAAQALRITAMAPVVEKQDWRLPRLAARDALWTYGRVVCRVAQPLVVASFAAPGCRQLSQGKLPAPLVGEVFEFEAFDEQHQLQLSLAPTESRAAFSSVAQLRVTETEIACEVAALGLVNGNDLWELAAHVGPGWVIDAVEGSDALDIAAWTVEARPDPRLRIALGAVLRSGESIQLRVVARKIDWHLGQTLELAELMPLQFAGDEQQSYLALQVDPGLAVRFDHGAWRPTSGALPDALAKLAGPTNSALTFALRPDLLPRRLTVEPLATALEAKAQIDAEVRGGELVETYQVVCQPRQGELSSLRVRLQPPSSEPLVWRQDSADGAPFEARRVAPAAPASDDEIWEIAFARPREGPFELRASRRRELRAATRVSLLMVEGAKPLVGRVALRVDPALAVKIAAHDVEPLLPNLAAAEATAIVHNYSYSVADSTAGLGAARIELTPVAGTPSATTLSAVAVTEGDPLRAPRHRARYLADRVGQDGLTLRAPPGARQIVASIDGRRVTTSLVDGQAALALPRAQRSIVVELEFVTPANDAGLSAPFWRVDPAVETLSQKWIVRVPPGYELHGPGIVAAKSTPGERLFGAWGAAREGAFRPFTAAAWLALWPGSRDAEVRKQDQWAALLDTAQTIPQPAVTWGQLIARWGRLLQSEGKSLWVDPQLLAHGAGPQQPLPVRTGAAESGVGLLREAAIATLIANREVRLTTLAEAQRRARHGELMELAEPNLYALPTAALRGDWIPAARWADLSVTGAEARWAFDPAPAGWTEHVLPCPPGVTRMLRWVDLGSLRVWGWIVQLAAVGWGVWLLSGRTRWLAGLLALAVGAALMAPNRFVPLTSGAVTGLLLALAWNLTRPARAKAQAAVASTIAARTPVASRSWSGTTTTALLIAGALCQAVGAQEAADEPLSVLTPIDRAGRAVGEFYYVPEPLWRALGQQPAQQAVDWKLLRATYRGDFAWQVARQSLRLSWLEARWEIETLAPHTAARLPHWSDDAARVRVLIDGAPLADAAQTTKAPLTFVDAGRHIVEVRWTGPTDKIDIDLPIPVLPTSRAEFSLPPDAPAIEFPSALGHVERRDERRQVVVWLGPAERLQVRLAGAAGGGNGAVEVEQLLWMTVQPGATLLRTRLRFDRPAGMDYFRCFGDRDLRLLSIDESHGPAPQSAPWDDRRQLFQFSLPPGQTGPTELRATLLVPGAGIGRVQLPELIPSEGRIAQRWLALSVDESLAARLEPAELADGALAIDEFLKAWGAADSTPQQAHALPLSASVVVAASPVEPQMVSDRQLVLGVTRSGVDVTFRSQLHGAQSPLFVHRIQAPPELEVTSVSARAANAEQVVRWSQAADGMLTLLLSSAPEGDQTVQVTGRLPGAAEMRLPRLTVEGARIRATSVIVLREPNVRVALENRDNLAPAEASLPSSLTSAGRKLVAHETSTAPDYGATLVISDNEPRVELVETISIERRAELWRAIVECRGEVTGGVLDVLRFQLPADWTGPFKSDPAGSFETNGGGEATWTPEQPLAGEFQVRFEAPLSAPLAPAVVPLDAPDARVFVNLPLIAGSAWDTQGLEIEGAAPEGYQRFRASGAFAAALVDRSTRRIRVELAAMEVKIMPRAPAVALATFVISGGDEVCTLELPPAWKLSAAVVERVAVQPLSTGENQYTIPLVAAQAAQQVELALVGASPVDAAGQWSAPPPRIAGAPPRETIWIVHGPAERAGASDATRSLSTVYCRRLELLIQRLTGLAAQKTRADFAARVERWLALYRQCEARARLHLATLPAAHADQERWNLLAKDAGEKFVAATGQPWEPLASELAPASAIEQQLRDAALVTAPACFAVAGEGAPRLTSVAEATDWKGRFGLASLVMALGVALVWRPRWTSALESLVWHWPPLAGVALGWVWWRWLEWSPAGFAILVFSLGALCWQAIGQWRAGGQPAASGAAAERGA